MKHVENQTISVPVLVDVLCDRCGTSCKNADGVGEFAAMNAHWEHPQPGWGEATYWEVHVCKTCWYSLVPSLLSSERLAETMGIATLSSEQASKLLDQEKAALDGAFDGTDDLDEEFDVPST